MGKITVKHYVNTRIKPCDFGGIVKNVYPVYVQIIYNKFSMNKRSWTGYYMTEKAFQIFIDSKEELKGEVMKVNGSENRYAKTFEEEKSIIEDCLLVAEKYNINVTSRNVNYYLERLSDSLLCNLYETMCKNYSYCSISDKFGHNVIKDEKYRNFLFAITGQGGIHEGIMYIKEFADVDLMRFVKDEDRKYWEVFRLVKKIPDTDCRVDLARFMLTYIDKVKYELKDKTLSHYEEVINMLENILNDAIAYICKEEKDV